MKSLALNRAHSPKLIYILYVWGSVHDLPLIIIDKVVLRRKITASAVQSQHRKSQLKSVGPRSKSPQHHSIPNMQKSKTTHSVRFKPRLLSRGAMSPFRQENSLHTHQRASKRCPTKEKERPMQTQNRSLFLITLFDAAIGVTPSCLVSAS